jgi:L-lactate dehydrogenase complex protein LldG
MAIGTIHNRESFLNNVAKKLNRPRRTQDIQKPTWQRSPQWEVLKDANQDELVTVLKKQCEVIHTQVIETTSSELSGQVRSVMKQFGAKSVVAWKDKRFSQFGLEEQLQHRWPEEGLDVHIWDPSKKRENIEAAERADVGITFSDMTLAESGTVVLFSDAGKGRSVSLLPKTYIAIIPKSSIAPRMTQATSYIHGKIEKGESVASCVNFITGPSNSADIELNLVVGVHGPVKATYIIVNDK